MGIHPLDSNLTRPVSVWRTEPHHLKLSRVALIEGLNGEGLAQRIFAIGFQGSTEFADTDRLGFLTETISVPINPTDRYAARES